MLSLVSNFCGNVQDARENLPANANPDDSRSFSRQLKSLYQLSAGVTEFLTEWGDGRRAAAGRAKKTHRQAGASVSLGDKRQPRGA
ncbi:hypothetical protein BK025_08365 [Sodalis sp. TME1]|nr:hypothetical protein BK025_08365 [Sodalis sp. TME1]